MGADKSRALYKLKPVTVKYNSARKGSVHEQKINAMLLNEFLKEHHKVQEQDATITQLENGMATVIARLEEQKSQIQKMGAQLATASPSRAGLEVSKFDAERIRRGGLPAKIVANNQ